MAKIMVSGPFSTLMTKTGLDKYSFDVAFKDRLLIVLDTLKSQGHEVFSAHIKDQFGESPWESDFVQRDLGWVKQCDAMVVLLPTMDNHELIRSDGTMIEIGAAKACGKPLIFILDNFDPEKTSFFLVNFFKDSIILNWSQHILDQLCDVINKHASLEETNNQSKRRHTTDVDKVLNEIRHDKTPYEIEVAGIPLTIFPGVLSPKLSHAPDALMSKWKITSGANVLDLGCGCGILGIAALKTGAGSLVALDINEEAVLNTQENLKKLGLDHVGEARRSDVYSALKSGDIFDIIIFAAPYWNRKANDALELSCYDEDYKFFKKAVSDASQWLAPGGIMYAVFSDQGDLEMAVKTIGQSELHLSNLHLFRPTSPNGHIRTVLELKNKD